AAPLCSAGDLPERVEATTVPFVRPCADGTIAMTVSPRSHWGAVVMSSEEKPSRWSSLREILRYVPRFRDRVFVIAVDGAIVEHDNFGTVLLDVALLRSLRIGIVLVHGASHQIRLLAQQTGQTPSDLIGTGVTDAATLQLAL